MQDWLEWLGELHSLSSDPPSLLVTALYPPPTRTQEADLCKSSGINYKVREFIEYVLSADVIYVPIPPTIIEIEMCFELQGYGTAKYGTLCDFKLQKYDHHSVGMIRQGSGSKNFFFHKFNMCENFKKRECEQYEGYLGACTKFLSKFFKVRLQYHGAHYHFDGMSRHNSPSIIIFSPKYQWYDYFEIRECEHYKCYLCACAKIFPKFFWVRPQYLGAHSHLGGMSRNTTVPKIIFYCKFHYCECFKMRKWGQYKGYLGTCAKILLEFYSVHPQYQGAHSQVGGMRRNTTVPKIIFFDKFHYCEYFEKRECGQYKGYLGACAKIF